MTTTSASRVRRAVSKCLDHPPGTGRDALVLLEVAVNAGDDCEDVLVAELAERHIEVLKAAAIGREGAGEGGQ